MLSSIESTSFLKQSFDEFSKQLNNQDFTKFSKLNNNFERFEFIYNLKFKNKFEIKISESNKNLPEAKLLKEKGNSAFQAGDYKNALQLYTKSLLKSPLEKENTELSIIRANRSAALYHLNKYQLALVDIEEALTHGYPKDMVYKLKDRKSKCLLALKQNKKGLNALKETLTALDDAKLPLERRMKWQKDIQIMISLMNKNKVQDEKIHDNNKKETNDNFKRNPVYKAASDAIDIKYTVDTGRFAEAKRNINIGEVILCEEPHCAVLLENESEMHCFHCFKRTISGEPCETCDKVKFCSPKCKASAEKTHHLVECKILETLWKSGVSITCLMALRIISQRQPSYFMKIKQQLLNNDKKMWTSGQYSASDYLTVSNLVTHEEKRTADALLHKTFIALYLFQCLEAASYFEGVPKKEEPEYYKVIGGLILHNLQLLQFNAHEISELECPKLDLNASKSKFIGGGLYPTLALFNHSCNPGLVRYFDGSKVIARAIRPISAGEMIAENYGPIFTEKVKELRKEELRQRYWFDCKCEACTENWPLLKDMDMSSMRFHCENKKCSNVIIVPSNTMDFIIKCTKCNSNINLLKGLKVLQDSDNLFRLAEEFLKTGEPEKALMKYTELLILLHEILAPPFRDYHFCQQGLRTCYVSCGNINKLYQI